MTKLAPEWVRTSDPVIRSPARYRFKSDLAISKYQGTGGPQYRRDINLSARRKNI